MKRRTLLSLLPATAAATALRPSSAAAAPVPAAALGPAGFAVTVQAWSFNRFTLMQGLERAATAGVNAIEIYPGQKFSDETGDQRWDHNASDELITLFKEKAGELGITPVNYGVVGIPNNEEEARKIFEFAKKLGLYGVTTEAVNSMDLTEKLAVEYDLMVCYHNHPQKPKDPNYKIWNPEWIFEQVKSRDPRMGICADLGHWATSGLDPLDCILAVAPRVRAFHMKDRASTEKWGSDIPFGTGVVKLAAILDEVGKHGFAGNVSIEYEANWEQSVPDIAQCAGFLRGYAQTRKTA